jgi:hypothetical protein
MDARGFSPARPASETHHDNGLGAFQNPSTGERPLWDLEAGDFPKRATTRFPLL